jgi:ABC-type lipoprotein export system ATPase subunit
MFKMKKRAAILVTLIILPSLVFADAPTRNDQKILQRADDLVS